MTKTLDEAYSRGVADTLALIDDVRAITPGLIPPNGEPLTLARLADALAFYDPATLSILKPFDVHEALDVKTAAKIAGVSPRTIAQWSERFKIGRLVVGALRVSHPALLALLDDDPTAIAALISGRRDHPAVAPYIARAGIGMAA